jgi:membrane protein implicated in regulation of membrane protease activity
MLAYEYPVLGTFLSILYFTLFFMWIWIAVTVFIDIFRSHDMNGWIKALWLVFVIFLPFLGVFVYLIARGGKMAEHRQKDIEAAQDQFNQAVQQAAPVDVAGQIEKLAALRDQGVLTPEEFEAQKGKLLA